MIRKRNIIPDSHARMEKKRETELLTLLERCLQIPKDQRLKLRDKIKEKDQEVFSVMRGYRKESDLKQLQLNLRKMMVQNRKQNSENKPSNVCWSYRDRSPIQISVEVIPVRTNRIQRELRKDFQREMEKEQDILKQEEHYSIPSCSFTDSSMGYQQAKQSEIVFPSHKVSSQTVSTPLNRTFLELTDEEMDQRASQGMFKKEKTSQWYEQFMGKYRNKNYESQYNTYKRQEQSEEVEILEDEFYQSGDEQGESLRIRDEDEEADGEQPKSFDGYRVQRQNPFNKKMFGLDLKLKFQSIRNQEDRERQDELFSFRKREEPKQQLLNQSTGIYKHQSLLETAGTQELEPISSPKQSKFGQFYKRLKQQLQIED